MSASDTSPTVVEVMRFEDLPLGSRGSRRAIVRWSDGSEGEALSWYADEILICEGDLIGTTREQLRARCTFVATATGFSPDRRLPLTRAATSASATSRACAATSWASCWRW
jgi:hypothetical protein